MKYKLLRFSLLSILAMLWGVVYATDPEVTLDFTGSTDNWKIGTTKIVDTKSFTYNGYTIKLTGSSGNGYRWYSDGYILIGKQGGSLELPAFDFDVEKIEVVGRTGASTGVEQNFFVGDDAVSTGTTGATGTNIYEISLPYQSAGNIYTLKVTSNANTQITKINIYKKGVSDKQDTNIVLSGEYTTMGFVDTSINLPTATVKSGNNIVADAEVSWSSTVESVAVIQDGKINPIAVGTTTIIGSYAGNDTYNASYVTYELTVDETIASPYVFAFNEKVFDAKSQTKKLKAVNWTVETDCNYWGYDGTKGQQFGSGGSPAKSLTLTTSDIRGTITSVKINTSGASSIAATVGVTVGETALKSGGETTASLTATATEYVFTGSASGAITISYAQTSSKAIYIKSIEVEYTAVTEPAEFQDFAAIVNNQSGTLLTSEEQVQGTAVEFGIAVDADGNTTRVATDDASSIATISGKYHSDHGMTDMKVVTAVPGAVKILVGKCTYSGNTITVTNSGGEKVIEYTPQGEQGSGDRVCWKNDRNNVIELIYNGEATTLTITGMGYCPFVAVKEYVAPAEFQDFAAIVNNQTGTLLTSEEQVQGTAVGFGVAVDAKGNTTRVATDDASSIATVSGNYHSDHGMTGLKVITAVPGAVKILVGKCTYSGNTITVTNSGGEKVIEYTPQGEQGSGDRVCWKNDRNNVIELIYNGEATTLTITGMDYCPFVAVQKTEVITTSVDVAYSKGDVECDGDLLPVGGSFAVGDEYTIPTNTTLYKDGYTLTAWSDGNNEYAVGSTITLADNLSLTPVFTQNTVTLADRTEPVTLKWNFRKDQGAPVLNYQNKDGFLVTQATIGSSLIDVKMSFTTNNGGKLNNQNNNDCAQCNNNTTFTIPSCKDAVVTMEAYGGDYIFKAEGKTPTTVDGQSDYTAGQTLSYTIAGTAQTVNIVMGNDAGYVRFVQVVLPVVESQGGGDSYDNATATVTWPMGVAEADATATAVPEKAFSLTSVSHGSKLVNEYTSSGTTYNTCTYDGITYTAYQPTETAKGTSGFEVMWVVKPAQGITFTPTKLSVNNLRVGTDGGNVKYAFRAKDGSETELGTIVPGRNKANQQNPNYIFTKSDISDLSFDDEFSLVAYIGGNLGNNKQIAFANVVIEGVVNGTAATVNKYTLATAVAPAEGGSVNVYPVADEYEYEEGSTIKLTATENFGYDFVNWTNADNEVVSTEPVYTFDIAKDETLTANFNTVETYELALTVYGTNDYMVTVNPAPTMVDGKMMYEAGTAVQLTANSYEGLVTFNNWSTGETSSSKLISMTADTELTAFYANVVDIIAGWDFYVAGYNGRPADFASADNESAALSLVNTESGEASGWLDKSTEAAGGYESFKGAAVNWREGSSNGDVGHYHWQTKVNATDFTDINVQFQMLYNFNAYQTYNAEYSLDGTTWTKFGSITMTGAKAVASFSQTLPAEANNQENLHIRMLADKTSDVDGTESKNDGNSLAMFFITGKQAIVDDGKAPELLSTVPAEGATGVSASGKVVLTFDEKVKVVEGATATLGSLTLTPVVSGKTISFEYKGLEYSTEYSFTLDGNTVGDLADNMLESPIALTFTTMTRPKVTKGLYDAVVGNVDELLAAINEANSRSDQNTRYRIFLKNGTYTLPLSTTATINSDDGNTYSSPITNISGSNISFIGESRDGVVITNDLASAKTYKNTNVSSGYTSVYDGIGKSDVLQLEGHVRDTYFQDLTVKSGIGDALGRNLAIQDRGSKTIYKNTVLYGYQDTWTSNNDNGLYYFEGGAIRGRTDYMCGKGDAFFNAVELRQIAGGYAAVPSKSIKYGFVYKDCTINGEAATVNSETGETRTAAQANGNYTLGRPWGQGTPIASWIDTKMEIVPSAIGWSEMSNGWPKQFAEWNSTNANGTAVDLSGRKTTFGDGHVNNPVLTAEQALEAGNLHNMFGVWDPTLATEQAPVPQNVKQEDNNLVWDNSDYALLWAIVKDGNVIDFTTTNSYELTESGTYAVRAANEMGGLSEASASVEATVAEMVKVTLNKGYSTLASDKALDFSKVEGLTAYIVTDAKNSKATLTSVDAAPAETGLVLKTDESGDYEIPVIASATAVEGNLLVAAVNGATVDALSVYVLDDGKFKVFAGTEIPAGKAYLPTSKIGSARLLELVFDDATGIATVPVDVNVPVYDLQGRRVKTAKKGIYVVDGKKVIIK